MKQGPWSTSEFTAGDPSTEFEICWDSHSSYSSDSMQGLWNCNKLLNFLLGWSSLRRSDRETEEFSSFESVFRHALPSTQLVAAQDEMKSSTRPGTTTDCWQKKQSWNHVRVGALGLEQRRRASTRGGYLSIFLFAFQSIARLPQGFSFFFFHDFIIIIIIMVLCVWV
jgi:hypothetical protein